MQKVYLLGMAILLSPVLMTAQDGCTPHIQVSNDFEDGIFIEPESGQKVANDFQIPVNTALFMAERLTVNLLSQGGIESADIIFLEDNNGAPGEVITENSFSGLMPTSQEIIGVHYGYDFHEVVFDFPSPIEFAGTNGTIPATYWIQIVAIPDTAGTKIGWESTTASTIGNSLYFDNEQTETWTQSDVDGVFSISGECTPHEGCFLPVNLAAAITEDVSVEVTWTEEGDATEWSVEYGYAGYTPGSGTTINASGTSALTISDFTSATEYDFYVKSICSEGESENVGPATLFFDEYCNIETQTFALPITKIVFAGISNTSSGYATEDNEYFLDMVATLVPGETYPIAIQAYTGGNFTTAIAVFIDWNQDYEFNNTDERHEIGMLTNSSGIDGIELTGNIAVPADAALGFTRMRVAQMWSSTGSGHIPDACAFVTYGQAEDYIVNIDLESSVNFMDYDFKMGPNPTNDIIQISSTENIQSIKVYNLLGQQVMDNQINVQSPQINMSSLQNGVYLMEVTIKDTREVFKIVKQ